MKKLLLEEDTFNIRTLSGDEYDVVVKGLRLLLLVGNDHDTMIAAYLLDLLLPTP